MNSGAPERLRLSREMRLRQPRDFARIRNQGERASKGCLIANWLSLPQGSSSQLGVITTRKLGKAAARARARRLLRETFRLHQNQLRGPLAIVLVARNSIANKKLADVERDYLSVLRQAKLLQPQ